MEKMKKSQITPECLPLEVREHLMRGQQDAAVDLLVSAYTFAEDEANQIIDDYREALRQRKIALEIQVMNDKQAKAEREQLHMYWIWGARIALALGAVILLYLLAGSLS